MKEIEAMNDEAPSRPQITLLGQKLQTLIDALKHESDMICAIVGTSYLELATKVLLKEHFRRGSNTGEALLKPNGHLGSLKAKADLVYCLGMIGKSAKDHINLIGEVRNRFAHNLDITFSDAEVARICNDKFRFPTAVVHFVDQDAATQRHLKAGLSTPRDRFITMVSTLSIVVLQAAIRAEECPVLTDSYWKD